MKVKLIYLVLFLFALLLTFVIPEDGGYIWQPEIINTANAMLFTLLVWLVVRLLHLHGNVMEVLLVAASLLLLSPSVDDFFRHAEDGFFQLFSLCIAPFFMSQYNRIHEKNFRKAYVLMFLMGVFCSYTHDGISVPLCAGFLWLSFRQRRAFFRKACWPMVLGFLVGTSLLLTQRYVDVSQWLDLGLLSRQTLSGIRLLWDTKIFIFAVLLTTYFFSSRHRSRLALHVIRRNRLIALCFVFSLCLLPFSPLGLEKSVEGVCFFSLLWFLILAKTLIDQFARAGRVKGKSDKLDLNNLSDKAE
jgi:hypothetical protein